MSGHAMLDSTTTYESTDPIAWCAPEASQLRQDLGTSASRRHLMTASNGIAQATAVTAQTKSMVCPIFPTSICPEYRKGIDAKVCESKDGIEHPLTEGI
ncbi:hypothetical protein HYFRA_00002777 [Hymenoscyphus fraxineus]|uniref:Uncharacterized protein n=1 Tax=Hymenoscyphus fraxineus TaxID=746836 RepID=A0A9N9KP70_9HELO|nr:hypothetical protein HYFRA_00002777 [Hymenoscyphus fraxineus]